MYCMKEKKIRKMFRNINSFIKINQWKYISTKVKTPSIHATGKTSKKQGATSSTRYNVCREHVPAKKKFAFDNEPVKTEPVADDRDAEQDKQAIKKTLQEFPTVKEGHKAFTPSNTRLSVVLPLKTSKLASPFPEPVKFIPSATVSDQEKAKQMQDKFSFLRSIKKAPTRN